MIVNVYLQTFLSANTIDDNQQRLFESELFRTRLHAVLAHDLSNTQVIAMLFISWRQESQAARVQVTITALRSKARDRRKRSY
jgi:hypothetical protein